MKQGIINVNIASLFLEPNKNSILVDEALHGTNVDIIEELESFYKIRTFYNYEGYMDKRHIELSENKIKYWNNANKMTISRAYIDIKVDTTVKSPKIYSLTKGAIVGVSNENNKNGYKKVYLVDGKEGYIQESFLTEYIKPTTKPVIEDEEVTRNNIVKNALSYLETQYRWGGKTPLGIDCSGLSFMSYLLEGIIIFRDAKIKEGFPIKEIEIGIIKKGDLIFFKDHVAIYIGKGEFVHSSYNNGGVYINSLNLNDDNYSSFHHKSIVSVGSIF